MPMLFLLLLVPGEVEPPKVGQPLNFSGAVGSFQVNLRVEPEKVVVEEPVKLTLQVLARGRGSRPPRRPDLSQQRGFAERFHIGRTASDEPDRTLPDGKGWEFDYELRPRSTEVDQVPDLVFTFYNPQNGYQTRLADAVPLTVEPKPQPVETIAADPRLFQLATGDQVLQRWHVGLPPWPVLVALAVLPPAICAAWYGLWAWHNPNAARQVRQRRSRAGRHALEALRHADAQTAPAIVTDYLRQRFDLPGAAPTPVEVAAYLRRAGCAAELAEKTAELFRTCDAARYSPIRNGGHLSEMAASMIEALEADRASRVAPETKVRYRVS